MNHTSTRASMAHPPFRGPGRWARVRRRRTGENASPQMQRYQQVIANDTLETQIQNETSPFPPTYTEHVSQRRVRQKRVSLAAVCIRVAAEHFSTHILPTPEVFERAGGPQRAKRRVEKDEYMPEEPTSIPESVPVSAARPLTLAELHATSVRNKEELRNLPPQLCDELFRAVCLYSPLSLTRDVLATYFLPYVGASSVRIRLGVFLPGSLPLFSNDHKAVPLLLATLAGQLSLSKNAAVATRAVRTLDLHGHTRMNSGALVRLLQAPHSQARSDAPPPRTIPQKRPAVPVAMPAPMWSLERVTLCGCLAVDDNAVHALVRATGHSLQHVDLSMTSVSAAAVGALGAHAPRLRQLCVSACEGINDDTLLKAVGDAVSHATETTWIPFQNLVALDVSRTSVGDVGVGGILRLCGSRLSSLDVGYTRVGEHGTLDMLRMGLGDAPLEHVGLAGLVLHSTALVGFVGGLSRLRSLVLDDVVEYARRHESSLSGRLGITGMALCAIARMVHPSFERISMRGEKRRCTPGQWALPADALPPAYTLGDAVCALLKASHVDIAGLELSVHDFSGATVAPAAVRHLSLAGTNVRDDALRMLVPWTGQLEALYLDDTPVTRDALDELVDANPALSLVSLSHCRGIPVRERRRYFDAYAAR